MAQLKERPKPFILPDYCKGCGRCIEACVRKCITEGNTINPGTGLIPVVLNLEQCTACGLCIQACPEPFALQATPSGGVNEKDPISLYGGRRRTAPVPKPIPDTVVPLPATEPLVTKGSYASAIGALLAGCRHFFGYPITPSTEGAELMAKLLPKLDGIFQQAVSEVATVNMMYGCSGAGLRGMTFTSSPGFSLMLEGISYMIGAELPGVFVNVMRGGPGLGNIAPEQSDIKLACHGLGHGNTKAIVLAPSTPQEMLDLTMLAFKLSFQYRNPVIVLGDGYLGQMTGKVNLPKTMVKPGIPEWAVYGDENHRRNLICSFFLSETELSDHNLSLIAKYEKMWKDEQRVDRFHCDDADVLVIATNTPARMAKGAVQDLRKQGIKAGLYRPITVWPFPIDELKPLLGRARCLVVVEASDGQLENELRLALSHARVGANLPIHHVRTYGGHLPQQFDIAEKVASLKEVRP